MFDLKRNLPGWERVLRLCLGALCAATAMYILAAGPLLWLALPAAGLGATDLVGFCPACAMSGRRSIRAPQ